MLDLSTVLTSALDSGHILATYPPPLETPVYHQQGLSHNLEC